MRKSYIENSLKRFLKRKVKITVGLVVTFMITGTIAFGADFLKKEAAIHINSKPDPINEVNYYLNTETSDKLNQVKNGILIDVAETLNINSENITISHKVLNDTNDVGWRRSALNVQKGGVLNLGNKNTKNITIKTVSDNDMAVGILAWRNGDNDKKGGKINIKSENLKITAESDKGFAYGIFAYNNTTPETLKDKERSEVIIDSKNIFIEATSKAEGTLFQGMTNSNGIVTWSQGIVKMNNGNVNITAESVINTRGDSTIEINANNNANNSIVLNGDVMFTYDKDNSGTPIDSNVKINLSNKESKFVGKIVSSGNPPIDKDGVTGMVLGLSNGGTWKATGDSFVNDLTMNGGILEVTENVGKSIEIDRLYGNNGTVKFEAAIDGENVKVTEGKVNITEVKDKTNLEVGFSGITADDLLKVDSVKDSFEQLQNKVNIITGKDKAEETYFAEEGKVTGKITAKDDGKGGLIFSQEKESKTIIGLKDLATINYLSWKQEMGSLTQRMGELRNSTGEHGVWSRVYGGKVENGSQYDNKYQTYQVGYDKKYAVNNGKVYLGYLVSYTDGETNYTLGHGENYSVGAGIYATWMNNNGHYIDVLYKVSRLNNKFDVGSTNAKVGKSSGEYDTYGISLSTEYGKRFDITEKWFAEPSIGMHLGRLGDETYTTNSGIEVEQDSIYTAEGRIGASVGYKFNDKGNIYARTHVVKEFAGDIDAKYTADGLVNTTSEDIGDTWFEFGVGVNYKFTENMNIYADIEKSGASTVDTKWQGNLGFRYEF